MLLNMPGAVDRLLSKFNMSDCRSFATPSDPNLSRITESPSNDTFPIRSLVGGLQYCSSICRPDIAFSVQHVARQVTSCTDNTVKMAERILVYLEQTKTQGLFDSKQN